jgi:glucans biosynthesis protein
MAQEPEKPLFDRITERARTLAGQTWSRSEIERIPKVLADLNYPQYRDIRFRKDHAIWKDQSLFSVELFHPGFLYVHPVTIHQVIGDTVTTVPYDAGLFDYGKNEGLQRQLSPELGFAGFRVHFPINRNEYHDEVIAFLGASYFRMVGRGQSYGLSARGLAINTAGPNGEEFPLFTEFWLVRPPPQATTMTFYALLESESLTGAYRFELTPGADTILDVTARLIARADIAKLGVAPLTSMFLYGENSMGHFDDFRPEVHDSDGLLMHTRAGEWIWRPLTNGNGLQVSTLLDGNPKGFGLAQRDRDFGHYLDDESQYHNRPSHWVSARGGDWGKGAVELIEIPIDEETNDNIVAFWVPEKPFKAGEERTFRYQIRTFGGNLPAEHLAEVTRTRIGWGAIPGTQNKPPRSFRQFIVDFNGGEIADLHGSQPLKPELTTTTGKLEDVTASRLPDGHGWRVAFKLRPEETKPADMRLFLSLLGRRVSETWSYVWQPNLIR